jgi:hypothetical protein
MKKDTIFMIKVKDKSISEWGRADGGSIKNLAIGARFFMEP